MVSRDELSFKLSGRLMRHGMGELARVGGPAHRSL